MMQINARGWRRLRYFIRRRSVLLVPLLSIAVACAVMAHTFQPHQMLHAIRHAHMELIVLAFLVGALIEVLNARRATLMLEASRPIHVEDTFGITILSHAVGRFIPFAPTTMALRSLLTYQVAGIPMAFSAGVFLTDSILDNVAMLPLLLYLLLGVTLTSWQHLVVYGMLGQAVLLVFVPILGRLVRNGLGRTVRGRAVPKYVLLLLTAIESAAGGLATVVARGPANTLRLMALSVVAMGLGMLRLALFLQAFDLPFTWNQLCLLMVLTSLAGNLPISVPGIGTWAATKVFQSARIVGPGLGGCILVLRVISSIETPVLALLVLLWWTVRRQKAPIRWSELRSLLQEQRVPGVPASVPATVETVPYATPGHQ